jgi:hypothetical protein
VWVWVQSRIVCQGQGRGNDWIVWQGQGWVAEGKTGQGRQRGDDTGLRSGAGVWDRYNEPLNNGYLRVLYTHGILTGPQENGGHWLDGVRVGPHLAFRISHFVSRISHDPSRLSYHPGIQAILPWLPHSMPWRIQLTRKMTGRLFHSVVMSIGLNVAMQSKQ